MPRRPRSAGGSASTEPVNAASALPEDDFVTSLKAELVRSQKSATEKIGEDLGHRAEVNRRLLQDLWEVHNQFEDISVHFTIEPSQTLFASFTDYPTKWAFRDTFDFGAVKSIELKDRSPGWLGFTLRFWYYKAENGAAHLRGIFEWTEGETYHRYSGWMRMMNQAVLCDCHDDAVNMREIHRVLKDVVVKWYGAHLERDPPSLVAHLKGKYPPGAAYTKESYRA